MNMNRKKEENHEGESFGRFISGVWRKEDPSHYKEIVGNTSKCTIKGQYMEITVDKVLENFTLISNSTGEARQFTLFHVIFRNLHPYVLHTGQSGCVIMIDSDGNQYEDPEGGKRWEFGKVPLDKTEELPSDAFPAPDLILHAGAKTHGWLYFRKLPKGLQPKRLIIIIRVFDAGSTSGWVRDEETFEFIFSKSNKNV
jgi:hypothetical protein